MKGFEEGQVLPLALRMGTGPSNAMRKIAIQLTLKLSSRRLRTGCRACMVNRSRVDLPQPEGPTNTMNSPSQMSKSTLCSTGTSPNALPTPESVTFATVQNLRFVDNIQSRLAMYILLCAHALGRIALLKHPLSRPFLCRSSISISRHVVKVQPIRDLFTVGIAA
jgi:hypothetical protein